MTEMRKVQNYRQDIRFFDKYEYGFEEEDIKWKKMNKVKDILLKNNIYIFGGFIRDSIIREYNESEYYKKCETLNMSIEEAKKKYYNLSFIPEFIDRLLVPKDIDCFIQNIDIDDLILKLSKEKKIYIDEYETTPILSSSYKYTSMGCGNSEFESILRTKINTIFFNIDLMHADISSNIDIYKVFTSNIDFECNNLILTPDNEYKLSCALFEKLYIFQSNKPEHSLTSKNTLESIEYISKIKNNIIQNKTVIATKYTIPEFRIKKFIESNWEISTLFTVIDNNNKQFKDKHCEICKGTFSDYKKNLKLNINETIENIIYSYIDNYIANYSINNKYLIKDLKNLKGVRLDR